jgi:hypothetical protein
MDTFSSKQPQLQSQSLQPHGEENMAEVWHNSEAAWRGKAKPSEMIPTWAQDVGTGENHILSL